MDGKGTFGNEIIIADKGAWDIFIADIDSDLDLDIIIADNENIALYENLDGKGLFSTAQLILNSVKIAMSIYVCDLDNDGDMDVLSTSKVDNKIAWYENVDGKGNFSAHKIITTMAIFANFVYAADLDNDGNIDVISTSIKDKKVAWYKNLTNPNNVQENKLELPKNFRLEQNYPNPFNPSTTIKYNLDKSCVVILKIYNLFGKELETLVNEFQTAGEHQITWQPKGLPSGIYFARLQTGVQMETMKLVLER